MSASLKASQKQERRVAKRFGGRVTPGSGNTWSRKNDVRTDDTSYEMKWTGKKQYTLKAADLELAQKQATMDGREFVFGIELNGRNWIVLDENHYASLIAVDPLLLTQRMEVWSGQRDDGSEQLLSAKVRDDGSVEFTHAALSFLMERAGFEPVEDSDV